MSHFTACPASQFDTARSFETVVQLDDERVRWLLLEVLDGGASPYGLISGASMTVGRGGRSDLLVPADSKLSRSHFSIECNERGAFISDLESSNGTLVNGRPIRRARLRDGDTIVAGTSTFVVRFSRS